MVAGVLLSAVQAEEPSKTEEGAEGMRQAGLATIDKPIDDDALLKSAKWRNLYFDKSGKSYRGNIVFTSINEAVALVKWAEEWCIANPAGLLVTLDGKLSVCEYSWAMQIPELP